METIPYSEVWYLMDKVDGKGKPVPFSFTCSTSEGSFLSMERAVKYALMQAWEKGEKKHNTRNDFSSKKLKPASDVKQMFLKVLNLENGDIRTVYPRAFIKFNGYKISFDL